MSVLADKNLRYYAYRMDLITPFREEQLQPASYDVRLGTDIHIPHLRDTRSIDLGDRNTIVDRTDLAVIHDGYALHPGRFILASTEERVNLDNKLVGRIEGKSSLARIGLQIHCAGYLDPGFRGNVTMEIYNLFDLPVILRPGVLIAQLSFETLVEPCDRPYQGRYQDAKGAEGSRYDPEGKMPDDLQ